jgi:predicted RNA-binding Zn-ribbon protein involved in translation (DUF1610 family)
MPDLKEITSLSVENELHTCPACGYERGFHTSFVNDGSNRDTSVKSPREVFRVILICPECGARYDVGWRVPFNESDNQFGKSPDRAPSCVPHGSPGSCLPASPRHDEHPPE